ncbi:hypothetical protein [Candidatus Mesenet endosymbiont of Agriotes lineatus]|uniref:hypothetical protein n=1 Tax=Candidatus Mesenet endosymbiont of Agriotes lineatus TaxID=3077948 RepID=UPI0030D594A1
MESSTTKQIMDTEGYDKILPKLLEKITTEDEDKYLSENTPIFMQYYTDSGLSNVQKQKTEDLEKLIPNIRIIDFNTLDLFEHPSLGDITISNYYKNLYSIPKSQRIGFGAEIDLMRVLILLKAGGALIELGKAKPELKIKQQSILILIYRQIRKVNKLEK